jgi:hypothetical protein
VLLRHSNSGDEINITNSSFSYQTLVSEEERIIYGGLLSLTGVGDTSMVLMKDCEFRNVTTHGVVGGVMSVQGSFANFGMNKERRINK